MAKIYYSVHEAPNETKYHVNACVAQKKNKNQKKIRNKFDGDKNQMEAENNFVEFWLSGMIFGRVEN